MKSRYDETIEWLFSQIPMFQNIGPDAYKPGLDTITSLCKAFDDPQESYRTIHVGGTNGKGSVSSLIASVLTEQGHKTGLFTSPHLVDFSERIRVNGEPISHEGVIDFIDRYRSMDLGLEPSFFELTTAMAFDWFARMGCDVAVIEVGLGGRLDSTNIITPELSVITNISLDHTALLGSTEAAITREKAGIIKSGIPVVIGNAGGEVREVFEQRAREVGAPVTFAADRPLYSSYIKRPHDITYLDTPWGSIKSPLAGDCQAENAATVFNALSLLPEQFDHEVVSRGFMNVSRNSGLRGRWERVSASPDVILDTGHNVGGWELLGPRLDKLNRRVALHMVIGFVNDKDIDSIMPLMPRRAAYYFARPSVARGRDAAEVMETARRHGLDGRAYDSVAEAFAAAKATAGRRDTIFVGGSTFVVADFFANKLEC